MVDGKTGSEAENLVCSGEDPEVRAVHVYTRLILLRERQPQF